MFSKKFILNKMEQSDRFAYSNLFYIYVGALIYTFVAYVYTLIVCARFFICVYKE